MKRTFPSTPPCADRLEGSTGNAGTFHSIRFYFQSTSMAAYCETGGEADESSRGYWRAPAPHLDVVSRGMDSPQ